MSNLRVLNLDIPAAGTVSTESGIEIGDAAYLLLLAKFENGSGGTSVKAYVQTSLDNGATWIDIACFAFTTSNAARLHKVLAVSALTAATAPTDGALADNTVLDGVLGDQIRTKVVVVGAYTGAHLDIWAEAK